MFWIRFNEESAKILGIDYHQDIDAEDFRDKVNEGLRAIPRDELPRFITRFKVDRPD